MTAHGGYLFGSPLGFTTKLAPAVAMKSAGFFEPSDSMTPDFSRIPADWIGTSNPKIPGPILAMSLGLDKLNIPELDTRPDQDPTPMLLQVPSGGWIAFEYVIDAATFDRDDTDGTHRLVDRTIASVPDTSIRSTVFNCLVPGSFVDAHPEGFTPHIGLVPSDLGIDAPTIHDEILGMDLHVALFDQKITNSNSFFTGLLPDAAAGEVRIFFTLNPDFISAAATNAQLLQGWTVGPGALQDTIFVSHWIDPSAGWSKPECYRHLPAGRIGPITALCIDTHHGYTKDPTKPDDVARHRILVSRRGADIDDKIEVALAGPGPAMGVLRNLDVQEPSPAGAPLPRKRVSRLVGAGRGLGDMCTADPKAIVGPTLGTEVPPTFLVDFSIARRVANPRVRTGRELRTSGFLIGKRHSLTIPIPFPIPVPNEGADSASSGDTAGQDVTPHTLRLRPHLRTMMNASGLRRGSRVVVDWYLVTTSSANWQPIGRTKLVWNGQPLVADRVFPTTGGIQCHFSLAAVWRSGKRASPACVLRLG